MIYSSGLLPFLAGPKRTLLAAAFFTHYIYRTLVYPLMTRNGKPAPLSVMLLGGTFCLWNGFVQVGTTPMCGAPPLPSQLCSSDLLH